MVKFGVIGSGWIAEEFVKGTQLVDGFEFSAMYSRTAEKGKAFADKFGGAPIYTDIDEFSKSNIDAVYIASPNVMHYSQSKLMLENGKHVLCEKPITVSPEEFSELYALANRKKLIYSEAIMMLYQPFLEKIKSELKTIGNITTAHFDFSQLSSKYSDLKNGKNPNIFNPKMKTGCLRDLGIYCFYPAVDFFGVPNKIISSCGFLETGADGYGTSVLEYDDKLVTLTYSKTGQDTCGSQIAGDLGTARFESISRMTGVKITYNDLSEKSIVGEVEKHVLMGNEAKLFCNFITDFEKNEEKYRRINDEIFEVNKLMFSVAKSCKIL